MTNEPNPNPNDEFRTEPLQDGRHRLNVFQHTNGRWMAWNYTTRQPEALPTEFDEMVQLEGMTKSGTPLGAIYFDPTQYN